ncbi:GntR family transcriptional regulator [Nocardiopsis flavescens]|uniref:DNA-binding transcriptional regulator, GntR family n=1 Tax=Nocardiopsis flavescens TaxID=758803 RepID=A0A1M6IH35_9ACTN|nr:GntR family transcriptional regulator [Nocardiopsis flavescens]SHJ33730.1 DNA-binding transcriptional regulator, GntR family [Nocardiopsis flavescens]
MTATDDRIGRPNRRLLPPLPSQAERVAELLREAVIDGDHPPGGRLSEERLCEELGVSRNTLREAFRLLVRERLVVHQMHRGVFVTLPTAEDVRDLFAARRSLELPAVQRAADPAPEALEAVGRAVEEGGAARDTGDWWGVGTANMHFHQALAGLSGSARIDEFMSRILAETRLVFHVMDAPREFHAPYLDWNRRIHTLLVSGDRTAAASELETYLDTSEEQLITAFLAREAPGPA